MYTSSDNWLYNRTNYQYVQSLRSLLAGNDVPIFIFLGAGFSFGVGRETEIEGREINQFEFLEEPGDDKRFPSWTQLVNRMKEHLSHQPFLKGKKGLLKS